MGDQPKTIRQLAAALGKSHTAVAKWLRDDRWPFARTGPWDVAAVQAWADRTLAPNPAAAPSPASPKSLDDLSPERQAKLALALERLDDQKFKNQLRRGEFHRVDECQQRRCRQVIEVKTALLNLADSLPSPLFTPEHKTILRGRILEALAHFAGEPRSAEPPPPPSTPNVVNQSTPKRVKLNAK